MNTVIANSEEALNNIRNAMNSIHKNIDLIMKEDNWERTDKAFLEDYLSINTALLSNYNFTERLIDKIKEYKERGIIRKIP